MNTEERIAHDEFLIYLNKEMIPILEECGQLDLANEAREKIKDLERSLEHDQKVQLAETLTSGRKEWWHNPWIYALVYVGGMATIKILEFVLEKLS